MPQRDLRRLYGNAGETKKPEEAVIEGNVPSWVNGTYLKVGKHVNLLPTNVSSESLNILG